MRVKTTRLPDFDGIELKEAAFQRQVFPTHFHETYSLSIVEHGLEQLTVGERELFVPAGSVVLLNPLQSHASSCFGDATLGYKSVYVGPEALQFLHRQQPARQPGGPWFKAVVIEDSALFSFLRQVHAAAGAGQTLPLTHCLRYLLAHYAGAQTEVRAEKGGVALGEFTHGPVASVPAGHGQKGHPQRGRQGRPFALRPARVGHLVKELSEAHDSKLRREGRSTPIRT